MQDDGSRLAGNQPERVGNPQDSLDADGPGALSAPVDQAAVMRQINLAHVDMPLPQPKESPLLRLVRRLNIALVVLVLLAGLGAGYDALRKEGQVKNSPSSTFDQVDLPLDGLSFDEQSGPLAGASVAVNGQLQANGGLVIAPSGQPSAPVNGQLYFDQASNRLLYFDGARFQAVASADSLLGLQGQVGALQVAVGQLQPVQQVTVPVDIARQGAANTFTANNTFAGGLSAATLTVSGNAALGAVTASSLTLGAPLGVGSGGTGVATLPNNGVLIGQGGSSIAAVTAGGAGLCLVSTAGAPVFQTCPGASGLSGAGTANQLAFFTDGTTLASDSNLFWDDTNNRLGIGTATPGSALDVNGDINTASGYRVNGVAGASVTCAGGQFVQNAVIQGGIVTGGSCVSAGAGSGVTTVGTIDSQAKSNDGATIAGVTLYLQTADATNPGLVSVGAQTFAGAKTFNGAITAAGGISGDGGGLTNLNASSLALGTVASARVSGNYTGITGTGALSAGSIAVGFGTINTGNSITGTVLNATTGFQVNGVNGLAVVCAGGQFLQDAVITGGIVTGGTCAAPAGDGGITTVGVLDSQTKSANGGVILGTSLYFQTADATNPGLVSTGTQTFAGAKTFNGAITAGAGISGDGNGLTNLNASNLASGTVATGRLSGSYTGIVGTGALTAGSLAAGFGTINTNNTITGTVINATTGFQANGVGGATVSCSSGQFLQNAVVAGGIVTGGACATPSGDGGVNTIGVLDSQTKSANGGVIVGSTLFFQTADTSNPGLVSTGAQTLAGAKTFNGAITAAGGISGDGGGLTNLNASNLSSGTVANGRVSGNYTGITGTGALTTGSISTGFGAINTGNAITGTTVNATTGFQANGVNGAAVTCTGGQFLQNAVVAGGIVTGGSCAAAAGDGVGVTTVGTLDSQTKSADGAVIVGTSIFFQTADASNPGMVSTGTQTFAGDKTFTGEVDTTTGFSVNGAAGATTTCTGGQFLQNAVIAGGIVTGGTCASAGGGGGSGVTTVGTIDSQTKSANGGVIIGTDLFFQTADATNPGLVSTGSQTFAGAKTFNGAITAAGGISGDGSGLTNLNASSLASGTVANGRLSGSYTGITGTGALAAGSITTGFGAISTGNNIATTATMQAATVNATTGFQANGVSGATTTCTGGQLLQNAVVAGGIITGGSCVAPVSSGVTTVGTLDSQTKSADGAVIAGTTIYMQTADASNPGLVSTGAQTFAGAKTFNGAVTAAGGISGDGSGLTNLNASNLASGTVANSRISGSYTGITGTGALTAGSIASGFGTIATGNTITGTTVNGTTGINTGAGAGTQRIDASGNLVNIAAITASGTVTGATINATSGFQVNGVAGATATCTGGQFLQNAVIAGGIVTGGSCAAPAGDGGVTTVGTIDSQTKSANGAVIAGTSIYMQTADTTNPGLVSTGSQTFAGAKTFNGAITAAGGISGDGSGLTNLNASSLATGTVATGRIAGSYTGITGTGALTAGSIASGFGTITTGNTITGTTVNGTTGINTGAGAGTQRIDASGNLVNIAAITASGTITGATINATTGFQVNGVAGATTTCTGGQLLQNAVIAGGIVTGGTCAADAGVTTVGTIDSQTKSANGAVIAGTSIYLQTADATNPGLVSTGTQTFAGNKTFNGSVTSLNDVRARAAIAAGYRTTHTGGSFAGQWTKLGTCTITVRFDDCRVRADVAGYSEATGSTIRATLDWRVKQQAAMGSAPIVQLDVFDMDTITNTDFVAVNTSITAGASVVELWGQIDTSSTLWSVSPTFDADIAVAWHANQGFSVSLPAGTQTVAGYADEKLASLTATGSITGATINATTGFQVNGVSGANTTCTGGQFLQDAVIAGGIVTGGTCVAASNGVTTVGTLDSQTKSADGAVIVGTSIYLQTADASNPGLVSTGNQTFAGNKTFNGSLVLGNASTDRITVTSQILGGSPLVLQGATDNSFSTTVAVTDPTANNTITLPNASGTVAVSATGNIALDAAGQISLTGQVGVANGGTGAGTFTPNGVLYGNGTGAIQATGAGTTGQCLKGNTSGAPTWDNCGTASTLQDAYDGSGSANPQINLNSTNGGLKLRDGSTPVSGNLFQIQNSGGTATYFGVSTAGVTIQNSSAVTLLSFTNSTSTLRIAKTATAYLDVYHDGSNAYITQATGTLNLGAGTGNINMNISAIGETINATKTATLAAAYSGSTFNITEALTGGANNISGTVLNVSSNSTTTGTNSQTILQVNRQNGTGGNLILATTGGSTERFKVTDTGAVTASGLITGNAGLTISGGNVSLNTSGSSSVSIGTGTSTGTVTLGNQSGGNNVLITANNFAVDATGNFSGVGDMIMDGRINIDETHANALRLRNGTGTIDVLNIDSTGSGTTGLSLQIGSATTDANAVELVLDSYNNATDPSGVNGAMYYNSALGKFRCYENSTWKNCIHPEGIVSKTADQTANLNSSVFQNATDLVVALDANSVYNFEVIIPIDIPSDNADAQYTFTVPSGATITGLGHVGQINTSGSTSSNHGMCGLSTSGQECNITIAAGTGAVRTVIVMHGVVKTAGTAGNLQFQFSQNAADSGAGTAPTLLQGGMIKYIKQ